VAQAAELRDRAGVLERLMPLYRQLEVTVPQSLGSKDAAGLRELLASFEEQVEASGAVLRAYEALGQAPPPHFRSWDLEVLRERAANMTAKSELLREVVQLDAQLGRTKMDWDLPIWEPERLRAHADGLAEQAAETAAHKEKQKLLGKVEAALWLRKLDPPIALHMMTTPQLRKLLAKLNGSPTGADANGAATAGPGAAAQASPKDVSAKKPAS